MSTRDFGLAVRMVRENMSAEEKVQLLGKGARAAKVSTYVTIMLTGIKAAAGLPKWSLNGNRLLTSISRDAFSSDSLASFGQK